ncbi:large T antigen [Bat polyomavirus]|uniref:large T antigen n=1 Tax=Bat polyomavirus TaxID=1221637 RepID=UPI000DC65768|nr:large T antigen [Bat polyomavirus]ART66883.1 large T antigen [Bat polyomavirus]
MSPHTSATMDSETLRTLSSREFQRYLNRLLLGSNTSELHDHGVYAHARKRKLLKHHPDKDPSGAEKTKQINMAWEEYQKRYRDAPSPSSSGSGTPGSTSPGFNASWDPLIAAHFFISQPSSFVSVFMFLAPYPNCQAIKRAVKELKVADLFVGKMENGLGMVGVHLQYRTTTSGMMQRVYKVTKTFHLGCVLPKRWRALKSDALSLFPEGFSEGTPDVNIMSDEFDYPLFEKFALDMLISDPVYLQGIYSHEFSIDPRECHLCREDDSVRPDLATHKPHHLAHHQNSKAFNKVKEKRKSANHATEAVQALLRLQGKRLSPEDFYIKRLKETLEPLAKSSGPVKPLVARAVLFKAMCPGNFEEFVELVYKTIVIAEPKQRGLIFRGPFDCGKTTVAQAIRGLFLGVSLNVNLSKDRLHFELGGALDQRMVVFDDVLGNSTTRGLSGGWGFKQLDQLRDHLDGCVPVGLERKHHNRVEQVFPPWVITCNEYEIPKSILARGKLLEFQKTLADPEGYMLRYAFSRSALCSGSSFALAQAIFLPAHTFPETLRPIVEMLQADAEGFIQECEGDLLDLACHEQMPPSPPLTTQESQDPIERFRQFISSVSMSQSQDLQGSPGEGPSGLA